jgi:hypothetical protein
MSKWTQRAKQHFSETLPNSTPITPKRGDTGVLGAALPHAVEIPSIERLLEAALRACQRFGDGPAAIAAMKRDVTDAPMELRPDLLAHFESIYGAGGTK